MKRNSSKNLMAVKAKALKPFTDWGGGKLLS
jgi:hypothetical protein